MEKGFNPIPTAEAWQISNAPIFSMAAHLASLTLFDEAGMNNLIEKSKNLTGYLAFQIEEVNRIKFNGEKKLEIITPDRERGCQLSILAHGYGKDLYNKLMENGIIVDWREPNVIRMAPVPLYNSFEDIYNFGQILLSII